MAGILWTIAAIIVALWLLGLLFDIAGNLIHLLLVIAAIVVIWNLISGRRTAPDLSCSGRRSARTGRTRARPFAPLLACPEPAPACR